MNGKLIVSFISIQKPTLNASYFFSKALMSIQAHILQLASALQMQGINGAAV